jgi:hypothetical protein
MKIGDLVQSISEDDDDVGAVIGVKPYVEGSRGCEMVCVYWGPNPQFGKQFEWDWDYDLKVVEES